MKRASPKRPAATPEQARKALRLFNKNIRGDELAAKLKLDPERAMFLAGVGLLIANAEGAQLTQKQADVLKVIARVIARATLLGIQYTKPGDVDFAGGFRKGTCSKQIVALTASGLLDMPVPGRIVLTRAGWALVWELGLIKENWTVPA